MTQAKEEEKMALNEQLKQRQGELQTANDQLSQSRFAVQSAYEDVQSAKDVLAGQQKQASSTVSSEIAGVASVDEKGKGSSEVPVVTVSSKEKQVKGIVTEYDLDKLVPGQTVQVTTVGNDKKVDGTIKSIATSALPTSGDNSNVASYEFIVEGDFPWTDDLSTLVTLQQKQLLLPDSAIKKTKNEKYIYKYVNGKVKKTAIQIVTVSGHNIVQKGLKANDKIIENPDDELKDGSEIQVGGMIKLEHVYKYYETGDTQLTVLEDVNFSIAAGEFVAIMGPSGSGKSTLINLLGFIDRHFDGRYLFNGREIGDFKDEELSEIRNRSVGFVFQNFSLIENLSVAENVECLFYIKGLNIMKHKRK